MIGGKISTSLSLILSLFPKLALSQTQVFKQTTSSYKPPSWNQSKTLTHVPYVWRWGGSNLIPWKSLAAHPLLHRLAATSEPPCSRVYRFIIIHKEKAFLEWWQQLLGDGKKLILNLVVLRALNPSRIGTPNHSQCNPTCSVGGVNGFRPDCVWVSALVQKVFGDRLDCSGSWLKCSKEVRQDFPSPCGSESPNGRSTCRVQIVTRTNQQTHQAERAQCCRRCCWHLVVLVRVLVLGRRWWIFGVLS